ncbi:MAG: ABC transporter ATP-binding protein/permease [Streptococcaceae bacterium]|jgi:ATP-binding cassette subfamily B protein|nr:ABC transporter ATP-binding protein/permease [Streptococcaceae bacterium]
MMRGNYLKRDGAAGRFGNRSQKPVKFWPTITRLFGYMEHDKWGVIFSLIIAAVSVILSVQAPKILGTATTIVAKGVTSKSGINFDKVGSILLTVAIIYAVSFVSGILQQQVMTRISQRTVYRLRKQFKSKMVKLPVSYYDRHSNGDIMSRMINDMDNIAGTLNQTLIQVVTSALQFIGVCYFMLTINWLLALVAFVTVPLAIVLVRVIAPLSQKYFSEQQKNLGLLNNQIEENYAGHTVIKTFNHQETALLEFDEKNEKFFKAAWRAQFVSTLIFPTMRFLNNLDYLAMAVIGGIYVVNGQVNIGDVQAMLQYTNQFSQPITNMSNLINTIQATAASAERIFALLDEEEMKELQAVEDIETDSIIRFDDVAFAYVEDQPLMTDVSIEVTEGEMVAIVGPTGAGKTTLINLLERFYESTAGTIRLWGKDTKGLSREVLRSKISMVLQDTWLFSGTIRDNLRYGKLEATDDEIYQASKMAYADEFIKTLPQGYDTVLNEEASNISQGQRQLLTIARAFLVNPEILILDEATSSVDTRTERMIQEAMSRLLKGRTSFVVAHRLSTIRDADQILVMNQGNIVEQGTHKTLLASGGMYADLYNSQFAEA